MIASRISGKLPELFPRKADGFGFAASNPASDGHSLAFFCIFRLATFINHTFFPLPIFNE